MVKLIIWSGGTKRWYLNHERHRSNGPTVCWFDGGYEWWWHNRRVTEYEHMMLAGQETAND